MFFSVCIIVNYLIDKQRNKSTCHIIEKKKKEKNRLEYNQTFIKRKSLYCKSMKDYSEIIFLIFIIYTITLIECTTVSNKPILTEQKSSIFSQI